MLQRRLRYLLTPPGDTRPSVLVELCPGVDETVLQEVREAMFGAGCINVGPIELRLERWLDTLVMDWRESVPIESWSAPLLTDVVPAASGALVRRTMARAMR